MSTPFLMRYTNLPSTLHILQNRCLTLLSPNSWDDRNDAFFVNEYKRKIGAISVFALCFAETSQTYHHWRVFTSGSDGACIEFNKAKLEDSLRSVSGLTYRSVVYHQIKRAKAKGIPVTNLPFAKRQPYEDEHEFRILFVDTKKVREFQEVPIPLDSITRITLSPWMPKPLSVAVKATLRSIPGCSKLSVVRSTLIENEKWKRIAS